MSTKFKRFVSVLSVLAVVMCMFSGFAGTKQVNAVVGGKPGPNIPPNPPPIVIIGEIEFMNVGLTRYSFPQGSSASICGSIIKIKQSVSLTVKLKQYYNSYSAYTIGTYTDSMTPNSNGVAYLMYSPIFSSQLNLASRPAGHYVLEIQAREGIKVITKTLDFYIT